MSGGTGHLCLRGRGPTFPPSRDPHREEREGGWFPPLLSLPQNCIIKIPIQSSHGGGEKGNRKPTLDPTRLTATDGDIWQEGGGARKFL